MIVQQDQKSMTSGLNHYTDVLLALTFILTL